MEEENWTREISEDQEVETCFRETKTRKLYVYQSFKANVIITNTRQETGKYLTKSANFCTIGSNTTIDIYNYKTLQIKATLFYQKEVRENTLQERCCRFRALRVTFQRESESACTCVRSYVHFDD